MWKNNLMVASLGDVAYESKRQIIFLPGFRIYE